MNWLGLLDSVYPNKTCSKLHVRLLLSPKLPTYFDDITTIQNNRQVRVNIDATLVAILRIDSQHVLYFSDSVRPRSILCCQCQHQHTRHVLQKGPAGTEACLPVSRSDWPVHQGRQRHDHPS